MPNLTVHEILEITPEAMPEFIRGQLSSRRLSQIVKSLNRTLLEGDEGAREMALTALRRLGFDEKS